jgi:quercetin dioxygenase-like cupin family protein
MTGREDDPLDAADRAWLALALDALAPDEAVRRRARARVLALARGDMRAVRRDEGDWRRLLDGIDVKRLAADPERGLETWLWRLAPGAAIPRHPHRVAETCLVVAGEIELDGARWTAGDWIEIAAGGEHGIVRSPAGALLLITSEPLPV